jgi:hypothetical protein
MFRKYFQVFRRNNVPHSINIYTTFSRRKINNSSHGVIPYIKNIKRRAIKNEGGRSP